MGIDCDWRNEVHRMDQRVNVCIFLALLSMYMTEQYMWNREGNDDIYWKVVVRPSYVPRNSSTIADPMPPAAPVTKTWSPSSSRNDFIFKTSVPSLAVNFVSSL